MRIQVTPELSFQELNDRIRRSKEAQIEIEGCIGQRYIASGLSGKSITIHGTPGNALGAYLDGCDIEVDGNAQDAVGDTMNDGRIIIRGNAGDALGYAMRGGRIYVRGNAGYRTGIHMKQYGDKKPLIVIGGRTGSFLGEYLAGGILVVLGLDGDGRPPVGNFTGTGIHGGKIFLRCGSVPEGLPAQVAAAPAGPDDLAEIADDLRDYADRFSLDAEALLRDRFYVLTPNTSNPYKRLYVLN